MSGRPPAPGEAEVVVLMGVCGCGKSTVGALLAERAGGVFLDGDAFHPPENVAKMAEGTPLGDADRAGWLAAIRDAADAHPGPWPLWIGCSALKRRYRETLRGGARGKAVRFVHLDGSKELLEKRMGAREGHFMKAGMLESQRRDLEPLGEDEAGFRIDIAPGPGVLAEQIAARLGIDPG